MLIGIDEVCFRMSLAHERIQLHLESWLHRIYIFLHDQQTRVLNSNNREWVKEFFKNEPQRFHAQILSNPTLHHCYQSTKKTFIHISRRIISPLIRELGRNSLASGGLGIFVGMAITRLALMGVPYNSSCISPMKPHKMRGAICQESLDRKGYDGLEGIRFQENLDAPRITNPDEVLVHTIAASIDPADVSILSGLGCHERDSGKGPLILGRDLSGIVVEVGRNIKHLDVGDSVWAVVPILERSGALAEYVGLPGDCVRRKPSNISHEGAATVPFAGTIAWHSLNKCGILPNAAKGIQY